MIRLLKTIVIVAAFFLWIAACSLVGVLLAHTLGVVESLLLVGGIMAGVMGYQVYQRLGNDSHN